MVIFVINCMQVEIGVDVRIYRLWCEMHIHAIRYACMYVCTYVCVCDQSEIIESISLMIAVSSA